MSAGRKSNSNKKDWNTPPKYIQPITEFFGGHIGLDPCSNEHSLVNAEREFIFPDKNGLVEEWDAETIFINPPYGRSEGTSLLDWIDKGIDANEKYRSELIYLIPVATNTKHFKELIFKKFNAVCFLADTRLKFYNKGIEDPKGAPMACCLCYLGRRTWDFEQKFMKYGKIFTL